MDKCRRDLQFKVGDRVFLKVSTWKGVLRFGRREKLRPRYIGPYEVIARVGPVAYRLDLPPELSKVHNVFHVSMLRKYIPDPSHVLRDQPVELKDNLTYKEQPMQIVDRREQILRNKVILLVKVLWVIMGLKRLHGSQRFRCAVNIFSCFQIKVSSLC